MARRAISKPKEIAFSNSQFDQWRLAEVGGRIVPKTNGKVVFQFGSPEAYQKYLELNSKRNEATWR